MFLRRTFLFLSALLAIVLGSSLFADNSSTIEFSESGVTCRLTVQEPWKKLLPFFGFSSILYQENSKGDRITFGLVATPFEGLGFDDKGIQTEIKSFVASKKDFVKEEGGDFISEEKHLLGKENQQQIYRVSVRYRLDGTDYTDSSYFRFVEKRLIHSKLLYPSEKFDFEKIDSQVRNLLGGLSCSRGE